MLGTPVANHLGEALGQVAYDSKGGYRRLDPGKPCWRRPWTGDAARWSSSWRSCAPAGICLLSPDAPPRPGGVASPTRSRPASRLRTRPLAAGARAQRRSGTRRTIPVRGGAAKARDCSGGRGTRPRARRGRSGARACGSAPSGERSA
jgi:hypothetical protein